MQRGLHWSPQMDFETGLRLAIDWCRANTAWTQRVQSGAYRDSYEQNYGNR